MSSYHLLRRAATVHRNSYAHIVLAGAAVV